MKNNKGFSLVELLAVVAIISILFGIGMAAYTRYTVKAREEAMDILVKSSINATESYLLDHPGVEEVNFEQLVAENYLESDRDPADKTSKCIGTVRVSPEVDDGTVEDLVENNNYLVDVCCSQGNYRYNSIHGNMVKTSMCSASFQERQYLASPSTQTDPHGSASQDGVMAPGTVCNSRKSKKFSIYTMDYLSKVCDKAANGKYGGCYDGTNPYGNINFPCRRYQYYQFYCTCYYSKSQPADKPLYCGYKIGDKSSHIMRIKYLENANGHAACNSDAPGDFNSYVHDVCWEGRYGDGQTVMTFHGYQFFLGKSQGYSDFRPEGTWFHDNIPGISLEDRVQRKYDILNADGKTIPNEHQGCRDTCVRFTEAISKAAR